MADSSSAPSTPASQAAANKLAGVRPPIAAQTAPPVETGRAAKSGKVAKEKKVSKKAKGAAEGGEKKKRKKPIKPIAIALVLLLVAYEVKGKVEKPHYSAAHPVPKGMVYDFPAAVTTNLPDGSLAQISLSLQLTKVGSTKVVTKDISELMGTAIQIIGARSYAQLLSPAGRVALQGALLGAFQTDLGMTEGAQEVSGVYFTSFVLQQQ